MIFDIIFHIYTRSHSYQEMELKNRPTMFSSSVSIELTFWFFIHLFNRSYWMIS
jgi:hypothetical protein